MVDTISGLRHHISLLPEKLLNEDEAILIVDDDPSIRQPLRIYLEDQHLAVRDCANAEDMMRILEDDKVALILLDIGLPDTDGRQVLPKLVEKYPDVAIVMLTGLADLKVAMECIREGADDYLSKPAQFNEILFVVRKTLEKRRLIFENRKYQEDLEKAHFRIHVLHQLSLKMNTAYLSTVEVDEILQAILVGITANEGLRFNRAFLAMFNEEMTVLEGRMAIGPDCRDEAGRIWSEIQKREMNFLDIVQDLRLSCASDELEVNKIIQSLRIPVSDKDNILIMAAMERRSIKVTRDNDNIPIPFERRSHSEMFFKEGVPPIREERRARVSEGEESIPVPRDLIELLGEDSFIVVPLFSPSRSFGVIIADNYVTGLPILDSHVNSLELFASQASLAIEHSHLYADMQKKIAELQDVTHELDKNKDMLVEAERYSALGEMAAQLVHAIRNPITSIGGVSRILAKKTSDEEWLKYLDVISKETSRLESILQDLFDFVEHSEIRKEEQKIYPLLRKTLMLVQPTMLKQNISWKIDIPDPEIEVSVDSKQMKQVFLHLVKNAIEAMPNGGKLDIVVRREGENVIIAVLDTGVGISETYLAQARDPFFTTKTYGTGLGLTMVERVINAHGGNFELHSRPSGGMEAKFVLPVGSDVQV